MWSNNLREIRNTIYRLKRSYGKVVYLRKPDTNTTDRATGAITRTYQVIRINKGVVLPIDSVKSFVYDLTYVAANKNFTYGGFFDKKTTFILVEKIDLCGQLIDQSIDHFVIGTQRFEISKSEEFEAAWYCVAKALSTAEPILDPYAENQ